MVDDFANIQDYVQNCEDIILKTEIEAAILKYHGGNYSKLTTYIGDIAPGFGTSKGGVQIQLPLTD